VLLSAGLPYGFDEAWFQAFTRGLTDACREYGCFIIGGDTVASPGGFTFTLTVIGEAEADQVVYRSGARPGDTVWVSGELGLAAAGLELLSAGLAPDNRAFDPFREKHLNPQARVVLGRQLAASGLVHAMMDLSDGLATDLAHLCKQSGVGARLNAHDVPGVETIAAAAGLTGSDPLRWAIGGGEDYELLFTADSGDRDQLVRIAEQCGQSIFPVGTIGTGAGVTLIQNRIDGTCSEIAVSYQGYDHFRKQPEA
jgi:thiamine-monophosphate kinase